MSQESSQQGRQGTKQDSEAENHFLKWLLDCSGVDPIPQMGEGGIISRAQHTHTEVGVVFSGQDDSSISP